MLPVDLSSGPATRYGRNSNWEENALICSSQAGEFFIENVLKGKGAEKKTLPLVSEDAQSSSTLSQS